MGELFSSQDVSIDDDANGIGSYLLRHEAKFRPFRVPCPSPSPGAAFKPEIYYLDRPKVEYISTEENILPKPRKAIDTTNFICSAEQLKERFNSNNGQECRSPLPPTMTLSKKKKQIEN